MNAPRVTVRIEEPATTAADTLPVVNVSGGKDSTALYLWAIDRYGPDGFLPIFADTGHEHPVTLNYLRNLPDMAGGPAIVWVQADFTDRLARKGLERTGEPFLDMARWKGRFPSTKAQFCTEHLKLAPIRAYLAEHHANQDWLILTGIRRGESKRRATYARDEWHSYFDCWTSRPLLNWSTADVFAFLEAKGVPPNPLYAAGAGRVGCYPCIHASKAELATLPDWAWQKLANWEAKQGRSWFPPGTVPGVGIPTIAQVREWCRTTRGGWQFPLFDEDAKDVPSCMSTWGICE